MAVSLVSAATVVEQASGTTINATVPASVVAGDLLVCAVGHSSSTAISVPSGWTLAAGVSSSGTGVYSLKVYRRAVSGDTAGSVYPFTVVDGRSTAIMHALRGVDTATVVDAGPSTFASTTATTGAVLPSITTVTAGAWLETTDVVNTATTEDLTVPSGFTQLGKSTGTGRRTADAYLTQASAGASGTVTWTKSGSLALPQAASLLAFRPASGGGTVTTPTVSQRVVGIEGRISVKTADASSVRIKAGTDAAVTAGVVYSAAATPDAQGLSEHQITGTAGVKYYYRVAMTDSAGAEVLDTLTVGRVKMAPTGQTSFAWTQSSCCNSSDSAAMAAIAARGDDLFFHMGDLWYADGSGVNVTNYRSQMGAKLAVTNHASVFSTTVSVLAPSDHDATMNNNGNGGTDPTALSYYNQVYRELLPTPTAAGMPATSGVYYQFMWGRVQFVNLDCRTFASNPANTDNSSKTMLGATQKAWLKSLITSTTAQVIVLIGDTAWTGGPTAGDDAWMGFTTERTELEQYFVASGKKFIYLSGDMHALAADSGVNDGAGMPLFASAPLNNSSSIKGGTWSAGTYPTSAGLSVQQYGRCVVTDSGSSITFAYTGYSSDNTARVTQTSTFAVGGGTATVGAARATSWNVAPVPQVTVVASRQASWNVSVQGGSGPTTTVGASRTATWNIAQAYLSGDVYADVYTDVYGGDPAAAPLTTVPVTRRTTWNVGQPPAPLSQVFAFRSAAWNVGSGTGTATVNVYRSTSWDAAAAVAVFRSSSWAVLGANVQVTALRRTSWSTFVIPPATTATTTPGMRLRVFLPVGADLGNLPTPESGNVTYPLNDVGALSFSYAVRAPRAELLGQPCELAVEVSPDGGRTWVEPPNSRFVYVSDGADPLDPANKYAVQARGYVWRLSKSIIFSNNLLNGDGKRAFLSKNCGIILKTLFAEAQGRGEMSGITHDSFTTALDSAGQPWAVTLTKYYEPGLDYMAVLQDMADAGLVDFKMQGRALYVYNADTMLAADRTVGAGQVVLRAGRDLTEAPFSRTWEALADTAYFQGDGVEYVYTNPAASTPWGRQSVFISNGSVSDQGTMAVLTQAELSQRDVERVEYTRGLDFSRAGSLPFWDYSTGDYVWSATGGAAPERLRVRQLTLQVNDRGIMSGNVVLNDRFLEADVRQKRRVDGITNGAQSGNGTGTPPTDPGGVSETVPAQVTNLTGSSAAYMGPGGFPQAQVTLSWVAVTTNTDGTPITDLDRYEVFQRELGSSLATLRQVATTTDTTIDMSPYQVGSNWVFSVGAVSAAGKRGARSAERTVGMAQDTVPPQAPSAPVMTSRLGIVSVYWDGNAAAGTWPLDFDHVEVHTSTVNNFTPTTATLVDTLYGEGAAIVSGATYGVPLFGKFVAVDKTPLRSVPSAQGTATPSRLVGTDLNPDAITYQQIGFKDPGNLILDGSFESETYRATVAGRSSGQWQLTATDAYHGSWSATVNGANGAGLFRFLRLMDPADVQQIRASEKLFCRMAYKASAGATGLLQLVVQWYQPDGTYTYQTVDSVLKNDTWQQAAAQLTAPAGVVNFRLFVQLTDASTSGMFWVDAVEVRRTVATAIIEDAAVKNAQIDNLAVNSAKISDLDVGKLTAGTMTADVLIGNRFMTATSGNRVQIDSTGVRLFRGAALTAHFDPSPGQLRIYNTGDASHTSTSHGIQFGVDNDANLIIDNNEIMARFNGTYSALGLNREGGTILLGGIQGGFVSGSTTRDFGMIPKDDNHHIQVRASLEVQNSNTAGYADNYAPLSVGPRGQNHLWFKPDAFGAATAAGANRLYIQPRYETGEDHFVETILASQSLAVRRLGADNAGIYGWTGPEVGLQFYQSGLLVRSAGFVAYNPITASAFTVASQGHLKHRVEADTDVVSILKAAPGKRWQYRDDTEAGEFWHHGPMVEDLPVSLHRTLGPEQIVGYDISSLLGVLWEAVRQINARLETVEGGTPHGPPV